MSSTRHPRSCKRRALTSQQRTTTSTKARSSNTQGLPCLADELYLEILSYLPPFPIPTYHGPQDIQLYGSRRLALDALSQTCRSLRRVCLRYRWERIEVYPQMDLGRGPLQTVRFNDRGKSISGSRDYAQELVRQLEVVTVREPNLAECVKVLDVYVTDYSIATVMPELARCMSLMPNLHTVQITFAARLDILSKQANLINRSFSHYAYPQIKTAVVSLSAFPVLARCPRVKTVHLLHPTWQQMPEFMTYATHYSRRVDKLSMIIVAPAAMYSHRPRFRKLDDYIALLSELTYLRDVKFKLHELPSDSDMKSLWKKSSLKIIRMRFVLSRNLRQRDVNEWRSRMKTFLLVATDSAEGAQKKLVVTVEFPQ